MIWLIRILFIAVIALLNYLRGYHYRIPCMSAMTIIMGLWFAITLHHWWLFPLVGLPMYGCLSLHDQNRGVWCSLVALGTSLGLVLTGFLVWYLWLTYIITNYLIGWLTNNKLKLPQLWEDIVTGVGFASLIFLI